jgi:NADH-quinone oxidoreductase subunit F
MSTVDLSIVDDCIRRVGRKTSDALALLQAVQSAFGYLPTEAIEHLAGQTDCSLSVLWSVATFYDQFRLKPAGRYFIKVCIGTACHVKGSQQIYEAFRRHLKIQGDEDTDSQRLFTVDRVACLGCCMLAPAVQIQDVIYGHLTNETIPEVLADFLEQQKQVPAAAGLHKLHTAAEGHLAICLDSSCRAVGSEQVYRALQEAVRRLDAAVRVKSTSCHGMSFLAPMVEVMMPDGKSFRYGKVKPQDAISIVRRHFRPGTAVSHVKSMMNHWLDALLNDRIGHSPVRYELSVRDHAVDAYQKEQVQIATEHAARIAPLDLAEYVSHGGFEALKTCIRKGTPQTVIDQVKVAGLRGRGGAGFPTHLKWTAVRNAPGQQKYIVCNGDEGDPGAFMDRMLMESYPFRILEGLIIAARTVGARQGYLYIREEYPLAVERVTRALELCRERGYLGDNIMGSDFSLDLSICKGAGAFVCGEETALLKSIEGKRPAPHLRPPYPARQGLWGLPTLINNVETYSLVPWIITNGGSAFAELSTSSSKGTKVFALAGKIRRGGLIEVPMGLSLRQIIDDIGGGIENDKQLKAVQIGGPSGGCVPACLVDTPIDFESLQAVGAIMGSGGMVVLDENDCMVDIARYFLEFTQRQSCGRCTFCRIGTKRMLEILERLCLGQGKPDDIDKLRQLAVMIQTTSLCGLGKTAPNPVLSTLEHFLDEYQAHIAGRCPAGKCRELIRFSVTDDCIGCTLCAQKCPVDAIAFTPYEKHNIDLNKCIRCGTCKAVCPADAVEVK